MYTTRDNRGILGYLITFIVDRLHGRIPPEKCPRCGKDDWVPKRSISRGSLFKQKGSMALFYVLTFTGSLFLILGIFGILQGNSLFITGIPMALFFYYLGEMASRRARMEAIEAKPVTCQSCSQPWPQRRGLTPR